MRPLFLSHQADFIFGGEVVTLSFLRELLRLGVDAQFAAPAGAYSERAAAAGVKVHLIPSVQFSRKVHFFPRLLPALFGTHRRLRQLLKNEGITVVHATSLKAMVYAWRLARHVPIIWHHHDILPAGFRNAVWLRVFARAASRILVPSEAAAAALRDAGIAAEKIKVLRNGFDLSDWPELARPAPAVPFRITMAGEISHRKGSDLIPAFVAALASKSIPGGFEIRVVGEGLSEPELVKSLREILAGDSRVKFLGRSENMKAIYRDTDLLWVPSRQDPLPTVIVEAGLSGVPVVAAPVGGIPEMIDPGINGFLAETPEAMADAVFRAAQPATWADLSRASRRLAAERYDVRRLAEQLLAAYRL